MVRNVSKLIDEVYDDLEIKRKAEQHPFDKLSISEPYGLQREIINHPARYKVIAAGRRSGKTWLTAYVGTRGLLDEQMVMISSTSKRQADVFWRYIVKWLRPLIERGEVYKNESLRILRYREGEVQVRTGRDPDKLRADYADILILDECAWLDPRVWGEVGLPMLLDTNGIAYLISSPKRRNWFFHKYQEAVADTSGQWQAWNFPSHANPHLSQDALAGLAANMTEDAYQQEIVARFLEGEGAVFRYVTERCVGRIHEPYPGRFAFGIDWAQKHDFTVIWCLDLETGVFVDYDRFRGVDWALQRGRVATMATKWQPQVMIGEENSIGSPNIEALQREGLPVQPFVTTASSKPPLIESLVLAFDRGEVTLPDDEIVKGEFMAYERNITATGRSQYSAPEGLHDDLVMAAALAWHAKTSGFKVLFAV